MTTSVIETSNFAKIPPSTFMMGSPNSEIGRDSDEHQHVVMLNYEFEIQTTTVTNALFKVFDPIHDSGFINDSTLSNDAQPVVSVSWEQANEFTDWLTSNDVEYDYRMPTEAEWECAARVGCTTRYWWGEDFSQVAEYANAFDSSKIQILSDHGYDFSTSFNGYHVTSPVASFKPNGNGLYDVLGNVWEMCVNWAYRYPNDDEFSLNPSGPDEGARKVARGGDIYSSYPYLRLANRVYLNIQDRVNTMGFRVVRLKKGDWRKRAIDSVIQNHNFPVGDYTWSNDIHHMFSNIDVEHMRTYSEDNNWKVPMDLADYENVVHHSSRIYSSVSSPNPRMPVDPTQKWDNEKQLKFLKWMVKGFPK